jgi:hypothetical protein
MSENFDFPLPIIIPPLFHTHLSPAAGTKGPIQTAVSRSFMLVYPKQGTRGSVVG